MTRQRLPNRRHSESFDFDCNGLRYTCTYSRFQNGSIGEIFLTNHKANSQSDSNAKDAAIIASLCLQHGVSIDVIRKALLRDSLGRPSTPVGVALDLISEQSP
jgi:hypothetical protein